MKVGTFTDYFETPSSRFRIRQYFNFLEENGIEVYDFYRKLSTETAASGNDKKRIRESFSLILKAVLHESANVFHRFIESVESNRFDAVWLSRELIIGYPSFESLIRKPIVYDIDDAIFLNSKLSYRQFRKVAERAEIVIAGNEFLAEEASKHNRNIQIIPTAVDTNRWRPLDGLTNNGTLGDEFRIGWSGTSTSFKFFFPIQKELKQFIQDSPSVKLLIMSDKFPYELDELKPYIEFIKWTPDNEVSFVQSLDVGLMPIENNLWSQGKCSYKMLLYAACGIPVIVTPVGMNKKLLEESEIGFGPNRKGEWYESLNILFINREMGRQFGKNGIALVKKGYAVDVCAEKLINVFKNHL